MELKTIFKKPHLPIVALFFALALAVLSTYYLHQCTLKAASSGGSAAGTKLPDVATLDHDSNGLLILSYVLPILLAITMVVCFVEHKTKMPSMNKKILFGVLCLGLFAASIALIVELHQVDNHEGNSNILPDAYNNGDIYRALTYTAGSFSVAVTLLVGYMYLL